MNIVKTIRVYIMIMLGIIVACKDRMEDARNLSFAPNTVTIHPYLLRSDSFLEPQAQPIYNSWKVRAGRPKVFPVATNIHPVKTPKSVRAGKPKICTPGLDTFLLPKSVPAIGKTRIAGTPEVVLVREALAKDQNNYNFTSLGVFQGLTNAMIYSILEDSKGNIWLGTYGGGVCRYDGVRFTHFTDRQGLGNNIVLTILEDKYGNLWFGTFGGGICRYDGLNFTLFTEKDGLGSDFVRSMFEDRNGNIWIGGHHEGVTRYSPGNNNRDSNESSQESQATFTRFSYKEGLLNSFIWTIVEDRKGNIWIGGGQGATKYDGKSFFHYTMEQGLSVNLVKAIHEDLRGNLWFGTWAGGVNVFNGLTFTHYGTIEGLSHDNVMCIAELNGGNIWIGTEGGGVSTYTATDTSGPSFTHFTTEEGLSHNVVNRIIQTRNGITWIATANNLNKYGGSSFKHFSEKQGLSDGIKCILEDKSGQIWIGGNSGLWKYDGQLISHFTQREGLAQDNVNCLFEDQNGNLWLGYYSGVTKFSNGTFTHFPIGNVQSIQEDDRGDLWFATYGQGIVKYKDNTMTYISKKAGLNSDWIWVNSKDEQGNFWLGTADNGISIFNPNQDQLSFIHFTPSGGFNGKEVLSIMQDKKGSYWFGTRGSGVFYYNPSFEIKAAKESRTQPVQPVKFIEFTEQDGLSDNTVLGMLEDKKGHFWFNTSNGISKLDYRYLFQLDNQDAEPFQYPAWEDHPLFNTLTYEDGYHGITGFGNSIVEDSKGNIWFSTMNRLTAVNPDQMIPDTLAPNLYLTGFAIFDEYLPWQNLQDQQDTTLVLKNAEKIHNLRFRAVDAWYGVPQELSLPYDNNQLTFRYAGITTHSPHKVKYQYKLDGLNKNWSELTHRTEIPFTNLSHGKYTFKVRAMNSEGFWSKELKYPFRIRPPWWLSGWAYAFYSLGLFAGIFYIDRYQRKRILEKERALSRQKELEQAKEIEKAYHNLEQTHQNLKATQTQLIQSEKMASLGELTAGIAHEIQNPLNFVNNFSEVNAELIEELQAELEQGNTKEAFSLSNGIKENESKISLHGKRAESIVKSMLQHSQKSSGVKEPTDINALADEYMRLSYHGLRAKNKSFQAELKMDLDPALPLVKVIPQDIGRVFLNLFNNAFWACSEYSQRVLREKYKQQDLPGPVTAYIPTVTLTTKGMNNHIEIRISDNGPGIPAPLLDKIFQPFFTTKPPGQGTGLGLSLAYDIVISQSGNISVKSEEEKGTEFKIVLPVM